MADVRFKGQKLGTVWCPPWRVELTGVVHEGDSLLEVEVVNLWPNRLIGDAKKPQNERLTQTNVRKFEMPLKSGGKPALLESDWLGPARVLFTPARQGK